MTAEDFDDFRIIVSTIQVDLDQPPGYGFWGKAPPGTFGYGGCILHAAHELDVGLHNEPRSEWRHEAEPGFGQGSGNHAVRVDPGRDPSEPLPGPRPNRREWIEVLDYTDRNPARFKSGPIGLQAHGGNRDVRYKDIFIETAPKQSRLITLKD